MAFNITIGPSPHGSDHSSLSDEEDSSGVQVSPPSDSGSHDYQDPYDEWAHLPYPDELKPSDSASRPRTSHRARSRHPVHVSSSTRRHPGRRHVAQERERFTRRPRRQPSPESPESMDSGDEYDSPYGRVSHEKRIWPPMAQGPGQVESTGSPPPPPTDTSKDEAIARLEKLILEERTEREAREQREAARQAALEQEAAEQAAREERAAHEMRIVEEAATRARAEAEQKAAEEAAKAKKEAEEAAAAAAAEAAAAATEAANAAAAEAIAAARAAASDKPPPEKKKPIKFKDAVGRKFSFPFDLCCTWQVWETVIEPDWTVTMHMWPIPEKPKTPEPAPPPDPPVPEAATASEALPAPEDVVVAVPAEEPKKKSDSTGASYACCFAMEFLKTRPLSGTPLALRLDLCRKLTCLLPRSEKAATKSP
ncbi:hypothetical protein APSETT444_000658 [Aspergillus pseudonomiae]